MQKISVQGNWAGFFTPADSLCPSQLIAGTLLYFVLGWLLSLFEFQLFKKQINSFTGRK